MKYLISFIFCFYSFNICFAQKATYRDSINMELKLLIKHNKVYHDKDSAGYRHYYFHKTQRRIVSIVFLPPDKYSAYYYYYLTDHLVMIRLQLPYSMNPAAIGKPMKAAYYFRNNILVEKIEVNFPAINLDNYTKLGQDLLDRAKRYLIKK